MSLNMCRLLLRTLEIHDDSFEGVLDVLGDAIAAAQNRLGAMERDDTDPEYFDIVVDDECDLVEELLGASFVVCQGSLTQMVSRTLRLHDHCRTKHQYTPSTTNGTRGGILEFGAVPPKGAPTSAFGAVSTINAFANYYKHNAEWRLSDWSNSKGREAKTVEVLLAAGASSGSTGTLRTGFEAILGHSDYCKVHELAREIETWRKAVYAGYHTELALAQLV